MLQFLKGQTMTNGTNAPTRPQFENQIVKYKSPHADVVLYDICKRNEKYGWLEWWALNDPTETQKENAFWIVPSDAMIAATKSVELA